MHLALSRPENAAVNFNERLHRVRYVISCCKYCKLTQFGKIAVQQALVASQLA